jgi:hypothetical protein
LVRRSPWLFPHFWILVIIVGPPEAIRSIARGIHQGNAGVQAEQGDERFST